MNSKKLQTIIDEEFKKSLLEEGFLDKLKAVVAKLPNLERASGPKKDAAIKQVGNIIDKQSNQRFKEMIKALDARLPNFPNVEKHEDFLRGMEEFAMLYDGIVEEFKDGKLDAPTANVLIGDLRVIVRKYLDYDLKDVYKHFKEHQEKVDEALPFSSQAKIDKELERQKFDDEGGPIGREFGDDSETIRGLRSNVIPKLLSMGGLGPLLAGASWFRAALENSPEAAQKAVKKVVAKIQPGEGFSQVFGRIVHNNPKIYGPALKVKDFFKDLKSYGITPTDPGSLAQAADNPAKFEVAWKEIPKLLKADPDVTMGEVFGGPNAQDFFIQQGAKIAVKRTGQLLAVGGAVKAGGAAAAGAGLAGFGAALLASGAAVKLLRMKGMKSSRAQVFNDMLSTFKDVEPVTQQQKQLQSGLEDMGVIKKLGPGDTPSKIASGDKPLELGAGELRKELEAGTAPKAISPGELKKALAAGTEPLSLAPGQIKRTIGAGESIPGDTGFTTPDGVPIAVGGIYNYIKNPKDLVKQFQSEEVAKKAAKNSTISEDRMEEVAASVGGKVTEKTFIKITRVIKNPGKPVSFRWIEVDPSTGKPLPGAKEQIPFSNLAKLGLPVDIADNPVARFAKDAKAQKKKDSEIPAAEPPTSTPDSRITPEMENRIRLQLQRAMNSKLDTSTRERALKDLYNVLMATKVIKPPKSSKEEPRAVTENNVVEILRDLKSKKILNIKENKINKLESVLKEHKQKLIEEQKIHNYWKKHAGLLKG
jgi:hypothetical protein